MLPLTRKGLDMGQRTWAWLILAAGILLALAALFADLVGVGGTPGFGLMQIAGVVVGLVLVVVGLLLRR
jgi:preprotein translocase subunit SecD